MFRTSRYDWILLPKRIFISATLLIFSLAGAKVARAVGSLAIVEAGVEQSEDAPFVSTSYKFLPGDYLYFEFQISGFVLHTENRGEVEKISLAYDVVPEDRNAVPLTPPSSATIETELSSEDKNWLPKRRVSFLIPSFVAAGEFRMHVHVKDLFANTEASQDFPFQIGGIEIQPSTSITVQNFQFFRSASDTEPLEVPAYSAGDTVRARFDMVGFKTDAQNQYHLAYELVVLRPDGKPFLEKPGTSELQASSFYPARYLPGVVNLKTSADALRGEYVMLLTVRDLFGNSSSQFKKAFSIE